MPTDSIILLVLIVGGLGALAIEILDAVREVQKSKRLTDYELMRLDKMRRTTKKPPVMLCPVEKPVTINDVGIIAYIKDD